NRAPLLLKPIAVAELAAPAAASLAVEISQMAYLGVVQRRECWACGLPRLAPRLRPEFRRGPAGVRSHDPAQLGPFRKSPWPRLGSTQPAPGQYGSAALA